MIKSRKELKVAVYLMLILQNGVFASLKCMVGIQVGGDGGYKGAGTPVSTNCAPDETCLRIEWSVMEDRVSSSFFFFFLQHRFNQLQKNFS